MNEPEIVCPNCSHEIKLTESLAAPLIEATRKQFRIQLEAKDADILKRELAIRTQQDQLARDRELIEEEISVRLKNERAAIAANESKKAREAAANELEAQQKQVIELQQILVERDRKLSEAQQSWSLPSSTSNFPEIGWPSRSLAVKPCRRVTFTPLIAFASSACCSSGPIARAD
jgi:hypothetical protein